jgi:acyl-CoA oxidase
MNYSAGISSVLPLFYVGWSDSVLSPSEMSLIRNHVQKMPFLTEDDKKILIAWTNPKNPPSESDFKAWIAQMMAFSSKNESIQTIDLVHLGIEMAKSIDTQTNWDSVEINPHCRN